MNWIFYFFFIFFWSAASASLEFNKDLSVGVMKENQTIPNLVKAFIKSSTGGVTGNMKSQPLLHLCLYLKETSEVNLQVPDTADD